MNVEDVNLEVSLAGFCEEYSFLGMLKWKYMLSGDV
jgi:hypothetical protein